MSGNIEFGIRLRADTSEASKLGAVSGEMGKLREAATGAGDGLKRSSQDVQALLDKYDPLGAKLKQLQADFKALDNAARSGQFGSQDTGRIDAVYQKIIAQTEAARAGSLAFGTTGSKAMEEVAKSAEKGAFATAGARRELIVLGHEAISGNFARMPGSFMVLAERVGLSGSAMMGVVAPIAAVALGLGLVAKAVHDGSEEMKAMDNALATTSGYSGLTRGTMRQLADEMTHTGQVTIGQGKDIVTALVASGRIGSQSIGAVAHLASQYAQATGQDIAEIAPQLNKLFADPAKGANELNRTMHFLTAAELDHLDALVKSGHAGEAQLELAKKLTAFLPNQATQLGYVARAWDGVKKSASAAWDAISGIGRGDTDSAYLGRLSSQLAGLYLQRDRNAKQGWGSENKDIDAQIAKLTDEYARFSRVMMGKKMEVDDKAARADKNAEDQSVLGFLGGTTTAQISDLLAEKKRIQAFKAATPELAQEKAEMLADLDRQVADLRARSDPLTAYLEKTFEERIAQYNSLMATLANRKGLSPEKRQDAGNAIWTKSFGPEIAQAKKDAEEQKKSDDARAKAIKEAADLSIKVEDEIAASAGKLDGNAYNVAFAGVAKHRDTLLKELAATKIEAQDPAQFSHITDRINEQATAETRLAYVTAAKTSIQQVENDRSEALKELQAEVTAGMLTQDEARRQGIVINQNALEGLQQHTDVLQQLATLGYAPAIEALKKFAATQATIADGAKDKTWLDGIKQGLNDFSGTSVDTFATVRDATKKSFGIMTDDLLRFVKTGKLSVSDLASSIMDSILRIKIEQAITQPFAKSINVDAIASFFGVKSAQGNVFSGAGISAYSNSVVTQPTLFAFANGAGLMGEKPGSPGEAIIPLTRMSGGDLGVKANGLGANVVVNIIESPGNGGKQQSRTDGNGTKFIDVFVEQVKSSVASDISRGSGAIPASLEAAYGLGRAPGSF